MTTNECPNASELALFLDGRASWRKRRRWVSHLDSCLDCRTVLGEAASYVEAAAAKEPLEEEKTAALFRWLRTPALVPAMAVLLLALLTAFVVIDPMSWFRSPLEQISTSAATAQLFATPNATYVKHRWVSEERGLGFSPSLGERERAFRAGVHLVDLRVAIRENQLAVASSILVGLDSLFEAGNVLSQLQTALASADGQERSASLLDALEASAETSLDSTFFPLGIWTESARLAAAAKEGAYFSHAVFTDALLEFLARDLPKPVASRLSTIDAVVSQGTPESNLTQLQRELRTLILLN